MPRWIPTGGLGVGLAGKRRGQYWVGDEQIRVFAGIGASGVVLAVILRKTCVWEWRRRFVVRMGRGDLTRD